MERDSSNSQASHSNGGGRVKTEMKKGKLHADLKRERGNVEEGLKQLQKKLTEPARMVLANLWKSINQFLGEKMIQAGRKEYLGEHRKS